MDNLLEGLNSAQLTAVTHKEGPLMIVAGAGTGKTTVITQRIAWLIEQKYAAPENILALTFTDKAAGEMEERVDLLLPIGYVDLRISTFHAFAEHLLRDYGVEIGLARDFTLVDELESWLLARTHFDRFELDYYRPLGNPTKHLRSLLTHFSRLKDAGISPDRYLAFAEEKKADLDAAQGSDDQTVEVARIQELARAYHTYQQILLEHDSLDFGDLILYTLTLLKECPNVLKRLQDRFTYILVDEFQDTNTAQYLIVKLLAQPRNNLTVVGDDDQAIYKFRGASLENILTFESDFPEATRVVLTENYRSGQQILDRAYAFIQENNPNRLETRSEGGLSKQLQSRIDMPGFVEHLHGGTLEDEVATVISKILALKQEPGTDWNDFAILFRANDAAAPFISALEQHAIPYQFLALRGLYTKRSVLDLLAYLRVIDDPYNGPSFYRILTNPLLELSAGSVSALSHLARVKGISLLESARQSTQADLPQETRDKIHTLLGQLAQWAQMAQERPASEILLIVAKESGYLEYLNHLPEREKMEAFSFLQQFFKRVKKFEERHDHGVLKNFLEEFTHERDAGEEGSLSADMESGPDMVRLMTIHASKGLEFKYVFVVNLVDRRFPTSVRRDSIPIPEGLGEAAAEESTAHLEEERRLFYVAMTRAKHGLFLTSAEDYGGARKKKLSRFLHELKFEKTSPLSSGGDPFTQKEHEQRVVAEAPFVYQIPKQFSFTQLTAFRTCPLQYKFAHVLNIPVFGRWTLSFGKTMHNTLQMFFTRWIERSASTQGSLFQASPPARTEPPVTLDELLELYKTHWIDDWYANNEQRERYRTQGRESLVQYWNILEKQPPQPHLLEQAFTLKLGGNIVVKGRIDRIDLVEGGVEIIDYKTGTSKAGQSLSTEEKEQLLLYQLAARDVLGLTVKKLTFHYLQGNETVSFLGKDEDLLRLQESIQERVDGIKTSAFLPTPGRHCTYCDFADICEFRKQ